jgi:hypothetical protein
MWRWVGKVCVCEREREREREGGGVRGDIYSHKLTVLAKFRTPPTDMARIVRCGFGGRGASGDLINHCHLWHVGHLQANENEGKGSSKDGVKEAAFV